jgi:hypothetical protein
MKYDYGDSVQLVVTLQTCEIVGITRVDSVEVASEFNVPLGVILYTVEFADGSDSLVPEVALKTFTKT